ncbi:uncharacterized protein LOC112571478 [Pomacea canaliculata]|uniref:uncharacterized protein LOC112571478 n=1 Tax=Pomacea canaliculata TaxID=400727 RepID=UPI000D7299AC|nr:uncharacterized protein LOC112571478 [Pomacea canaliculata]
MLHRAKCRQLPKGKVPLMLGIIDSIDFTGIDAGVVVRDQTGQMQGTLHRDVLRDFGAELQAGAAIVLRQVSVISPSSRTHYLNITSANIVAIYPSQGCTGQVILPGSLLQSSASGQTAQQTLKTYIHTADVELIEEGNKRMENTLVSMRQRMGEGTLPQAPFTPGSVRGNQQPPNTMTECRVQRLPPVQHNMSQGTPLTPQYQFVRNSQNTVAQPAHSSSSSRFTFKKLW